MSPPPRSPAQQEHPSITRPARDSRSASGTPAPGSKAIPGHTEREPRQHPGASASPRHPSKPGPHSSKPGPAPSSKPGPRQLAWKILLRWEQGGVFAETLVAQQAGHCGLSRPDRAMLQAMVYDTLRNRSWLEHLCENLRQGPLEKDLRWLLMLGLCQLLILHYAEHAAVSETVSLAPKRARGLINAVLRNAIRRRSELATERTALPLHLRYSTPEWLVNRWLAEFGPEETQAMLEWNLQTPPLYARLNPMHPMRVPDEWEALPGIPLWYRIHGALPAEALDAGQLYVADPSTRHCIRLLDPKPGERLLDACAAPGGKAVAMIGATGGDLHLLATDLHQHRLPQLRDNLMRAGGRDIQVARHDWSKPCPEEWLEHFDAVLLDVPCSNSGVLQRRVDVRWRLTEEEISRLAALQRLILAHGADAVRPGGRLVYSTCSIDREEDRSIIDDFLRHHPQFELVADHLALPHREKADGAYAALLQKLTR